MITMKLFFIFFTVSSYFHPTGQFVPEHLQVEGMSGSVCTDMVSPRFSWQIRSDIRGERQTAYQVIVASSKENIRNNVGDMYNSGRVVSSNNMFVAYDGKVLKSATKYYWKVKVWNRDGSISAWSDTSSWLTGLIYPGEKLANWIANPDKTIRGPLFRKQVEVDKPVKHAVAFATGIGAYYLYVNGQRINDTYLDPGMTNYKSRIFYQAYDITNSLQPGANVVGLQLGEGMGAFSISKEDRFRNRNKALGPFERPMAWFQVVIDYKDGSQDTILTDTSWKTVSSHITYNNFYGGEDYDARKQITNWSRPDLDDSDWKHAEIVSVQSNLRAAQYPPIKIKETFRPRLGINPRPGLYRYDFGQNIGGVWSINVTGREGTRLKIRGSERITGSHFGPPLSENAEIDLDYTHSGEYYFRDCISNYTLSGSGNEFYQPSFFYTGFRYLQVEVDNPEDIQSLEPQGKYVYSDLEQGGDFQCSDTLLNKLHRITDFTMKGIIKSAMLSNPHSEKFGWLGDSHLFSEAANYTFNMYPLYKSWLEDMSTSQAALGNGMIPSVNPPFRRKEVAGPTSPAWGATLPIYVLNSYRYYGDIRLVQDYFDEVKAWCDYLGMIDDDFIVKDIWADHGNPGLGQDGQFLNRGSSPEMARLVGTAYYFRTAEIVSELAGILGRNAEKEKYRELSENIRNSFNAQFLDHEKSLYQEEEAPQGFCNIQTSNAIPLEFSIVPKTNEMAVLQSVISDIRTHHHGNLFTGILGTRSLMIALLNNGHQQLFYDMLHESDFPGYKYWVDRGATTLFEFWNGESGDHMHARFGAVDEFNFNYVLGIRSPNVGPTTPGFKHIHIEPWVAGPITWAKGHLETPQGKVSISWTRGTRNLQVELNIPVNSTATLGVPPEYNRVYESGHPLNSSNKDITLRENDNATELRLGSGSYSVKFTRK